MGLRNLGSAPALGAGGPEFKSRRPDQNISRVFFGLLKAPFTPNLICEILAGRRPQSATRLMAKSSPRDKFSKNTPRRECHSEIIELTQGRKSCDIAAFMLGWLIEKGSVRFGSQACGVLGSFFEYAFAWTPS